MPTDKSLYLTKLSIPTRTWQCMTPVVLQQRFSNSVSCLSGRCFRHCPPSSFSCIVEGGVHAPSSHMVSLLRRLSLFGFVTNTEERVEELVNELDEALRTEVLSRSEGEKLRGRLQFASSQVFGRKFRKLLKVLSNHVTQGRKTLSQHTQSCLRDIRKLL